MIALDVDGTLVGANLTISDRVRDAAVRAQAAGIRLTIVTGRMFSAARPFAATLKIDGPIVCYQGAAIYEATTGALVQSTPVAQDVTREALAMCEREGWHGQCYADDKLYVQSINAYSRRYTALSRIEPTLVSSLADAFHNRPTLKIVIVTDPNNADGIIAQITHAFGSRAYVTRSHPDFVEIINPAVNKGTALAFIAERAGATLAETLAVGDAWNDLPLLEAAGIGIAMGSAPPELVACADGVVADVEHDGVAEAIERYALA